MSLSAEMRVVAWYKDTEVIERLRLTSNDQMLLMVQWQTDSRAYSHVYQNTRLLFRLLDAAMSPTTVWNNLWKRTSDPRDALIAG